MILAAVIIAYVLIGVMVAGFINGPGKLSFVAVLYAIAWPVTILVLFIVFVCQIAYYLGIRAWIWLDDKAN